MSKWSKSSLIALVATFFPCAAAIIYFKHSSNEEKPTISISSEGIQKLSEQTQASPDSWADMNAKSTPEGEVLQADHENLLNEAYSKLEGKDREEAILNELQVYAYKDPASALSWVLKMAPDRTQKTALSVVFSVWGASKPDDAAEWIMQNLSLPNNLRSIAATSLATSWVLNSPQKAMNWSDSYYNQTGDYFAFQDAIITWSNQDLDAMALHVQNSSYDDAAGYIAVMDFLNIYAEKDLDEARNWARNNVPYELQPGAQAIITRALAKSRPSEAASYVLQEDNAANYASNLGPLLHEWTKSDATAARTWVDNGLSGARKDMAHEHLARIFQFEQPELAIQYAQTLGDIEKKDLFTADILINWREQNQTLADQWIRENIDSLAQEILQEVGYE